LKRRYYQQDRSNHAKVIAAIRKSFYDTTQDSIKNYWRHIGYTTEEDAHDIAVRLNSEGFFPGPERSDDFVIMTPLYRDWRMCLRLLRCGIRPPKSAFTYAKDGLNGVYWNVWENKTVQPNTGGVKSRKFVKSQNLESVREAEEAVL
jgi:hypothetical protein